MLLKWSYTPPFPFPHVCPGLDYVFIFAGPCPSHTSFTARSSCPHLRGKFFSLGANVTIPGQNYKYSSWHHFVIIPKLIDGVPSHAKGASWLKWSGIVTWVPNEKEFPYRCGQDDHAVKEAWKGRGPINWRCDLARGCDYVDYGA